MIADPDATTPKRKLVGALGEHKAMLDNADARAFVVENIKYLVQKAKTP